MKEKTLLEILVRDLPGVGGWPAKAVKYCSYNGEAAAYNAADNECVGTLMLVDESICEVVYKEQYETALAASKKPAWNGEGLPPVGCECEYNTKHDGARPVRIECVVGESVAFTWLDGNERYSGLDCINHAAGKFAPLRTEEEKKRDAEVNEFIDAINLTLTDIYASRIFMDAVRERKIPGIKLDD